MHNYGYIAIKCKKSREFKEVLRTFRGVCHSYLPSIRGRIGVFYDIVGLMSRTAGVLALQIMNTCFIG